MVGAGGARDHVYRPQAEAGVALKWRRIRRTGKNLADWLADSLLGAPRRMRAARSSVVVVVVVGLGLGRGEGVKTPLGLWEPEWGRRGAKAPKRRRGQDPARVVGGLELAEVLGAVPHGAVRLVSWPDDLKHPPIMQLWPFCRHLLSD